MALADHRPAFETEDNTATATATIEAPTMNAQTEAPAAPAAATATAVAPAQSTAVGKAAKFQASFAEQKDAFPVEAIMALSMAIPRIKAEQGALYIADKSLGERIRITLESWSLRHLISPGLDSKDAGYEESKQYLATSYDGRTVEGKNQTIDEYIAYLKSIGYAKAGVSKYGDLFGMVTWTAKGGNIPAEEQTLHLVQASQTSLGNFMAFCTTQGLLRSKGIGSDPVEIEVVAQAQSKGVLKYSNMAFTVPKA